MLTHSYFHFHTHMHSHTLIDAHTHTHAITRMGSECALEVESCTKEWGRSCFCGAQLNPLQTRSLPGETRHWAEPSGDAQIQGSPRDWNTGQGLPCLQGPGAGSWGSRWAAPTSPGQVPCASSRVSLRSEAHVSPVSTVTNGTREAPEPRSPAAHNSFVSHRTCMHPQGSLQTSAHIPAELGTGLAHLPLGARILHLAGCSPQLAGTPGPPSGDMSRLRLTRRSGRAPTLTCRQAADGPLSACSRMISLLGRASPSAWDTPSR